MVRQVLERLREHNITANKPKCVFNVHLIEFYGHEFSNKGVTVTNSKISAILNAGPPETVSELRSLLGMAQYVCRFIPNYSDIVAPLQKLTHKAQKWQWTSEQENAFKILKDRLLEAHTLSYYAMKLQTELIMDASPVGLEAILTQATNEGEIRVVAYASRRSTGAESRYSQTEREALAVVWASEHFHLYLFGTEYKVITDNMPLLGIMNNPISKPTRQIIYHGILTSLQKKITNHGLIYK